MALTPSSTDPNRDKEKKRLADEKKKTGGK